MSANSEVAEVIREGPDAWNRWRAENRDRRPNLAGFVFRHIRLAGGDLADLDLTNADFSNADLSHATLRNAKLQNTTFDGGLLEGANFDWATLRNVSLVGANLRGAVFRRAAILGVNFTSTNLSAAHFSGTFIINSIFTRAVLSHAEFFDSLIDGGQLDTSLADVRAANLHFVNADLSATTGLGRIIQHGPINVSTGTLLRSRARLSKRFLRSADIPSELVAALPSLGRRPSSRSTHTCFISYSSRDERFVRRLHSDLMRRGVRCWLAAEDLKVGERIRVAIDEAIDRHEKTLLVLSRGSVEKSVGRKGGRVGIR